LICIVGEVIVADDVAGAVPIDFCALAAAQELVVVGAEDLGFRSGQGRRAKNGT